VIRGLLADLDDTVYDYLPAHRAGLAAVVPAVARALGVTPAEAERAWNGSRDAVKARLGATAASHSRLLYAADLVHAAGRASALAEVRGWDRAYWSAFLDAARLRPFAIELFAGFRAKGGKVAIVTDLMLDVQLRKLERFGLFPHVDVLVASEEVPRDKPAPEIFQLALTRLGLPAAACVMIGDHATKDGQGALALGIPFHQVVSSERPQGGGKTLAEIAALLNLKTNVEEPA
jgi:putative hydrolase of the HAD superfamily